MRVDLPSSQVCEECSDEIDAAYLTFVSSGFVSLIEDGEKVPNKILRDSGALGSFILASVLLFSKESDRMITLGGGHRSTRSIVGERSPSHSWKWVGWYTCVAG